MVTQCEKVLGKWGKKDFCSGVTIYLFFDLQSPESEGGGPSGSTRGIVMEPYRRKSSLFAVLGVGEKFQWGRS